MNHITGFFCSIAKLSVAQIFGVTSVLCVGALAADETLVLEEWVDLFDYQVEAKSVRTDGHWIHLWQRVKEPPEPYKDVRARQSYNCAEGYIVIHVVVGYKLDGSRSTSNREETKYPEPATIDALNLELLCSMFKSRLTP